MKKTWYLAIVSLCLVVSVVSYCIFASNDNAETFNLLHKNVEALADSEGGSSDECENVSGGCLIYGIGGEPDTITEGMRNK